MILWLESNVFFAGLVSFFMDVSSEMIYSLVPVFLSGVLGINKSLIGMIEGAAESTASLVRIFSGTLSDRLGKRKWLMMTGYAISVISRPVIATAGTWPQVLGARLIDRLGKGVRSAPRDAIIAESTTRERLGRAFSFHRAMDTLGAVAGPLIAFLLLKHAVDLRTVFWISIVPGGIAVALIFAFVRETGTGAAGAVGGARRPEFKLNRFEKRVWIFLGIAGLFALGNSSDAFLLLRAQNLGVTTAHIPVTYLVFNLVYALSAVPAGVAADRFGRRRLIFIGFLLFAGVYAGFARATTPFAAWALFALYGVFMGLTEGIQKAFLATLVPSDLKATAFGLYAFVVGVAAFPASLVAGRLWDLVSPAAPFYFGAITGAAAAILFFVLLIRPRFD